MDEIQNIYGAAETYKPVQKNQLILTTRKQDLQDEVNIRTASKSKFGTLIYACLLPWKVRIGKFLMDKGLYFQSADWGNYKETLIANTNFRKFDDNLRMVISGSARQRKALDQYLAEQYRKGLLAYSMRVSNRALMTCMISDYKLYHIHFVDGADGGYTMASMMLKQQLNSVSKIS
ncbi:MAG: DUF3095 family protein [Candidatus Methanofishera endochildressiae]|uniref:DUF3095 family protein n=1 Tax=Candidatus Methanofishera endochildressiae TaxID=2738884 RepID=A0A7Z0SDF4_9GAMM|nr:DUF3095 family protein [Candidatus Methanofishera endochildressiae]